MFWVPRPVLPCEKKANAVVIGMDMTGSFVRRKSYHWSIICSYPPYVVTLDNRSFCIARSTNSLIIKVKNTMRKKQLKVDHWGYLLDAILWQKFCTLINHRVVTVHSLLFNEMLEKQRRLNKLTNRILCKYLRNGRIVLLPAALNTELACCCCCFFWNRDKKAASRPIALNVIVMLKHNRPISNRVCSETIARYCD